MGSTDSDDIQQESYANGYDVVAWSVFEKVNP